MHALYEKCKGKCSTGIIRTVFESQTCFQTSKIQFYNVRFLGITKNKFLLEKIAFFGASLRENYKKN